MVKQVGSITIEDGQRSLTDEQLDALRMEAYNESEGIVEKKEPEKEPEKEEEDALRKEEPQEEDEGDDDQEEEEVEEDNSSEDDETSEEEEDNSAEEHEPEGGEPSEDKQDKQEPGKNDKEQAMLQSYAERHKLTVEQAAEDISKNKGIMKKFNDDPLEVARALRAAQSDYDKVRNEVAKLQQQAQAPKLNDFASINAHIDNEIATHRDELISAYRETYPGLTEEMSDNAIVDLMRKEAKDKMYGKLEEQRIALKGKASEKREALISNLPDIAKPYAKDIKDMLSRLDDTALMELQDEGINDFVAWAIGKNTDIEKLTKEAEERGYKRAMEQKKIIAEKSTDKKKPSSGKPNKTVYGNLLTSYQKKEALDKFESILDPNWDDERKFKEYYDIYVKPDKES